MLHIGELSIGGQGWGGGDGDGGGGICGEEVSGDGGDGGGGADDSVAV